MLKENPATVMLYSKLIHQKKTASIEGVKMFAKINNKQWMRRRSSTTTFCSSSGSSLPSSSSDEKRKSKKKRKLRKKTRSFLRQSKECDKSEKMEAHQQLSK